jgi:hypothetical protein
MGIVLVGSFTQSACRDAPISSPTSSGSAVGRSASSSSETAVTADSLSADSVAAAGAGRCIVRLHGKGGGGEPTRIVDGVAEVAPDGNADGWGGRQWVYFPDERYDEARDTVATALDAAACATAVIDGFSNGAAFAGALLCRGEVFDGRVVGYVIDDPVPDRAVEGCTPAPDVRVALYWTGALEPTAQPGVDCASIDWTCAGGSLLGIDAYAEAVDVEVSTSPNTDHQWFRDAPELAEWLGEQR